ncbi:hypothetical protein DERP_006702 [Dermatophagoides pteronyssinus]|uniref:Uncharacterized protein n=1 Tax=Dermatophagoides pteronyssinus TaxID=6956 RepID=A0ABQ8IQZ9_DERPT|nr:hypothetical protein DERP_006702 [Dermatophagoides pteronyssinus]
MLIFIKFIAMLAIEDYWPILAIASDSYHSWTDFQSMFSTWQCFYWPAYWSKTTKVLLPIDWPTTFAESFSATITFGTFD